MPTLSPDLRYAKIVAAVAGSTGVAVATKRGFGHNGLTVGGKLFATLRGQALLLKLPANRVAVLIAVGDATPFDAGKGRPMREWVTIGPDADADWLALTREAMEFVKGGSRTVS